MGLAMGINKWCEVCRREVGYHNHPERLTMKPTNELPEETIKIGNTLFSRTQLEFTKFAALQLDIDKAVSKATAEAVKKEQKRTIRVIKKLIKRNEGFTPTTSGDIAHAQLELVLEALTNSTEEKKT